MRAVSRCATCLPPRRRVVIGPLIAAAAPDRGEPEAEPDKLIAALGFMPRCPSMAFLQCMPTSGTLVTLSNA